jgi:hypothetical protein
VGIPEETPSAILDTIKLNAKIAVDITHVSIFQPYPGTKLEKTCREQNLLRSGDLAEDFCSSSVLRLGRVSPAQVLMFRDYFRVFMRCYRIMGCLPAQMSRFATRLLDGCLSAKSTARFLNTVYLPSNYVFRRIGVGLKAWRAPAK